MPQFRELSPDEIPGILRKESSVKAIVEDFRDSGAKAVEVDLSDIGRTAKDLRRLINSYSERNNVEVRAIRRGTRLFLVSGE